MKKILFLNPNIDWDESLGSFTDLKFNKLRGVTPPLGLAYLVSIAKKYKNDFEIKVIDANAEKKSIEEVIDIINKDNPTYVMISTFIKTRNPVLKIAKELHEEIIKIVGGADPSSTPETYYDVFDIVVTGEGEIPTEEILKGISYDQIPNIHYKEGNEFKQSRIEKYITEINEIPFPAWEYFPYEKYQLGVHYIKGRQNFNMIFSSRGCPYKCKYCASNNVFKQYRERSAENVFEEINYLYTKFNVRTLYIWDDMFTLNIKRTKEICQKIIDAKMDINWCCLTRADAVTNDLLDLMKKAGCFMILYGVETTSEKTYEYLQSRPELEKITRAITLTKKAGIMVKLTFIIGFPTEKENEFRSTLEFAKKMNVDLVEFHPLLYLPSTALQKDFTETPHSDERLYEIINSYYKEYYFRPRYIFSRIKYLFNMRNIKSYFKIGILFLKHQ